MFSFNSLDSGNFDCQFCDSVMSENLCRDIKEQLKIHMKRERERVCVCAAHEMLPPALTEQRGLNSCRKIIQKKLLKRLWPSWGHRQKRLGVPTLPNSFQTWRQITFVRHTKAFLCSLPKPRSKPERFPNSSGKGNEKPTKPPQNKLTSPKDLTPHPKP